MTVYRENTFAFHGWGWSDFHPTMTVYRENTFVFHGRGVAAMFLFVDGVMSTGKG
ncbi:MAG: hypothetical protein HQK67_07795 [Desulfamplus sp.]|nr:hypothetical protein [Desulfamplus sp.]